jgi:hypothetical protein
LISKGEESTIWLFIRKEWAFKSQGFMLDCPSFC